VLTEDPAAKASGKYVFLLGIFAEPGCRRRGDPERRELQRVLSLECESGLITRGVKTKIQRFVVLRGGLRENAGRAERGGQGAPVQG